MAGLTIFLTAVLLGGSFGSASASVESSVDGFMTIDLQVEVNVSAEAVVAHLSFDTDRELIIPLLDRGGGLYGTITQLERKNYYVAFEVIGPEGDVSDPVSLADMGVDLSPEVGPATTTTAPQDEGLGSESRSLLWLTVALAAASLSALAFWVLGGRDASEDEETSEPGDAGQDPEPVDEHSTGDV